MKHTLVGIIFICSCSNQINSKTMNKKSDFQSLLGNHTKTNRKKPINDYPTENEEKIKKAKSISEIKTINKYRQKFPFETNSIIKNASKVLDDYKLCIGNNYKIDINRNHINTITGYYRNICDQFNLSFVNDIRNMIYEYYKGTCDEEIHEIAKKLGYASKMKKILSPLDDVLNSRYTSEIFKMLIDPSDENFDIKLDTITRLINMGLKVDEDFPFFENLKLTEYILNKNTSCNVDFPVVLAHYLSNILYPENLELTGLLQLVYQDNFKNILKITTKTKEIHATISLLITYINKNKSNNFSTVKHNTKSNTKTKKNFFTYGKPLNELIEHYNDQHIRSCQNPIVNLNKLTTLLNNKTLNQKKKNFTIKEKLSYSTGYNQIDELGACILFLTFIYFGIPLVYIESKNYFKDLPQNNRFLYYLLFFLNFLFIWGVSPAIKIFEILSKSQIFS